MKKILLLLVLFVCLIATNQFLKADELTKSKVSAVDSALTENNIYVMLLINNIKYPEVVLSQIMIESGNLTSKLCKRNNNILGMTVATKRETTALNESGYAKYKSWFDCIVDYKFYQDLVFSKHKTMTKKQYIAYLHKNYAKSPTYKTKLTQMSKIYELRNTYNFGSI